MQEKGAKNGSLSLWGAMAILLVFYSSALGMSAITRGLGADVWIAWLMGFIAYLPVLLILARLIRLLPGMDIFDMLDHCFGRKIGACLSALYLLYFIAIAAGTKLYYGTFIRFVSLPNTPLFIILLTCLILCAYLARSGPLTLGKWSLFIGALVLLITLILSLLAIPHMRIGHLLPMAVSGSGALTQAAARFTVFPLGEAVVMLALAGHLDKKTSPYKLFLVGGSLALSFFVLIFLRDASILGERLYHMLRYPSFKAVSVIRLGSMGTGGEVFWAHTLLLAGLTKIALCFIAAARALRRMFSRVDEKAALLSISAFSLGASTLLLPALMAVFILPLVYLYTAPLFQFIIPALMWMLAEIKTRRQQVPK